MMTMIAFIMQSLKECWIVHFITMKWTTKCSCFSKLMRDLFIEIDPDFHFYTESYCIKNTQCDNYLEDTFVDKFKRSGSFDRNLSIFHLNIKSLPKHYDELEMYLDSLRFPISFIGLTETWLNECKENLYDLPQYVSVTRYRKMKRGGGV